MDSQTDKQRGASAEVRAEVGAGVPGIITATVTVLRYYDERILQAQAQREAQLTSIEELTETVRRLQMDTHTHKRIAAEVARASQMQAEVERLQGERAEWQTLLDTIRQNLLCRVQATKRSRGVLIPHRARQRKTANKTVG